MKSVRKPTFAEAVVPIISMFFILLIGRGIYSAPIEALLIISAAVAAVIAGRVGLTWDDMIEGVSEKIAKAMPAILILIAVGIVVGTWMLSGTIPMLIYYGIQIVNPKFYFVTCFVICAILSTCTGTSWGSCATIGVVLVVIAQGLGISLPITAGAVVGGSYFGDKMSPLSDTTNLAPLAAGSNIFDHIHHMFYTTIPASLGALIIYGILGLNANAGVLTGTDTINGMLENITSIFKLNVLLLFIPVIIILVGSVTRKPTIPVMLLSSLSAGVIAVFYQGFSVQDFLNVSVSGFSMELVAAKGIDTAGILPEISNLLNRGGINSMLSTVGIVLAAAVFGAPIKASGAAEAIFTQVRKFAKTPKQLMILCTIMHPIFILIAVTYYVTYPVMGEMVGPIYEEYGLHKKNLSRTFEDTGTISAPLIPWGMAGAFIASTLGIGPAEYWMYMPLSWMCALTGIVLAITGIGVAKTDGTMVTPIFRRKKAKS